MNRMLSCILLVAITLISQRVLLSPSPITQSSGNISVLQNLCMLSTDSTYSVGALVEQNDRHYRCSRVLGPNAQPTGVAWIQLERKDSTLVITGPTQSGICARDDLRYTVGAFARFADGLYGCIGIMRENLAPAGVAWVEVESKGSDFIIKDQK